MADTDAVAPGASDLPMKRGLPQQHLTSGSLGAPLETSWAPPGPKGHPNMAPRAPRGLPQVTQIRKKGFAYISDWLPRGPSLAPKMARDKFKMRRVFGAWCQGVWCQGVWCLVPSGRVLQTTQHSRSTRGKSMTTQRSRSTADGSKSVFLAGPEAPSPHPPTFGSWLARPHHGEQRGDRRDPPTACFARGR